MSLRTEASVWSQAGSREPGRERDTPYVPFPASSTYGSVAQRMSVAPTKRGFQVRILADLLVPFAVAGRRKSVELARRVRLP
jgi:hypothetical protein